MSKRLKHGGYAGGVELPEHYVWRSLIARCCNTKDKSYRYYGGSGVAVHPRWRNYLWFLADMGPRPSDQYSIDRIDNKRGYEPGNCRWTTRSEQQKNKRNTVRYTDGKFVGTPSECAAYLGISRELACYRMRLWGSYERTVQWQQLRKTE